MGKRLNCWDFKQCGFGPDGSNSGTDRTCPAALESSLDEIHGGHRGGRACWMVSHTFYCGKGDKGDHVQKYNTCMNCDFYWHVREEEEDNFELTLVLQNRMRND